MRRGANVVGTVAFAGQTSGLVVFYSTMDVAQVITAAMLGIDRPASTASCPTQSASSRT